MVNRTTKSGLLNRTFEEKEKHFHTIIEKQEQVANKSLETEREKMVAEKAYIQSTDAEKERLHFRIIELESKQKDIQEENERLRQERDSFLEQSRQVSIQEARQLEEQASQRRKIEEAEKERRAIEENNRILALEREREVAVDLQKRRALQEKQEEQELMSIPRIDRSVKPNPFPDFSNRVRDFSPVRGGLVSKNFIFIFLLFFASKASKVTKLTMLREM